VAKILTRKIKVYLGPRGDATATFFGVQLIDVTYLLKNTGRVGMTSG